MAMLLSTSCAYLSCRLLYVVLMASFCTLSCVAEEKAWMASREPLKSLESVSHIQDRVDCRPKWRLNPDEIATYFEVIQTDTFRLRCPADGKPKPTIRWLKNGVEFNSRWKGEIKRKGFALEVKEAQGPYDEGNYTCIVSNKCGYIQQDFFVKVIVRYSRKPVFDGPYPTNQTVTVGSDVTLVCRSLSDSVQMTYWLKIVENNTQARELKTDERHIVNETHLIIHSVARNDSGQYACVAVNEFGSNVRSAWLFVSNPVSTRNDSTIDSQYNAVPIIVVVLSGAFVLASMMALISACCIRRSRKKKNNRDKESYQKRDGQRGRNEFTNRRMKTSDNRRCQIVERISTSTSTTNSSKYILSRENFGKRVPREVVLHKSAGEFGFTMRQISSTMYGSKPVSAFRPTAKVPALQRLNCIDPGSQADRVGLKSGDYIIEVNNECVTCSPHLYAVHLITSSSDALKLKVVEGPEDIFKPPHNSTYPQRSCSAGQSVVNTDLITEKSADKSARTDMA